MKASTQGSPAAPTSLFIIEVLEATDGQLNPLLAQRLAAQLGELRLGSPLPVETSVANSSPILAEEGILQRLSEARGVPSALPVVPEAEEES